MLKRKMYQTILDWKNNKNKECLMVKGGRQTGKTFIIRHFCSENYNSFIEINFLKNPEATGIFEGNLSAEEIYKRISFAIPEAELIPKETAIFLDEIQVCPKARTALKFLAEDNRFDVFTSGSLLGLSYGQDADERVTRVESVPVGYESIVSMYPLDFEEFLWGYGYSLEQTNDIRNMLLAKEKIPKVIHDKLESLVREYIVVGGMPEVVADFAEHKDFARVDRIQKKILDSYNDDIVRHAKNIEKAKVRKCFDSIPRQLARENKKFKYSEVEKGTNARKFGESIQWLYDANIVNICYNLSTPQLPLRAYEKENEFKTYLNDTGLLMCMYGFETKKAFLLNELKGEAKGGIYENYVAQTLISKGYHLYYYKPDDNMEIEFVIEKKGGVLPIEVKAGNNATKSLNRFISDFKPNGALKVINGNMGNMEDKMIIPHYLMGFV